MAVGSDASTDTAALAGAGISVFLPKPYSEERVWRLLRDSFPSLASAGSRSPGGRSGKFA